MTFNIKGSEVYRNIMVSSPAGSGKTERLARRYIELLTLGVEPERILAITFTEKAAAEMKERIFTVLQQENPELARKIREKILKVRISTIHSFCLSMLRRFSSISGLDPNLEILDDPKSFWREIVYDTLMRIGEREAGSNYHTLLMQLISENGFKGWNEIYRLLEVLFHKRLVSDPFRLSRKVDEARGLQDLPLDVQSIDDVLILKHSKIGPRYIDHYQDLFPDSLDPQNVSQVHAILNQSKELFLSGGRPRHQPPKGKWRLEGYRDWTERMTRYWSLVNSLYTRDRTHKFYALFRDRFLKEYTNRKREKQLVDFEDLELLTYYLISEHPEWTNILYAFDEHTDHILVDEFQDTNFLQWSIIKKLTEEWRAGFGAKRELMIEPTLFLVGDEKQSIYYFRGANVEVFSNAKNELKQWLPENKFSYIKVMDNYRSLQSIIDFTNKVFGQIMNPKDEAPAWKTRYSGFERRRKNEHRGRVEIILTHCEGNMEQRRRKEAELVAKRIISLVGNLYVYTKEEEKKVCSFDDITVLLRKRTYLSVYEQYLRRFTIPFVVLKGVGFYEEPEVAFLRSFVSFLADPSDDYNLYCVLKSPLFGFSERDLFTINQELGPSLFYRLKKFGKKDHKKVEDIKYLEKWLHQSQETPLSLILEEMMEERQGWKVFWQPQRTANVKKFIQIVEDFDRKGRHILRIRDYFEKNIAKEEEPKANVSPEGIDAVRIMTIHAAKGLQFPVVFVVGLDEKAAKKDAESLLVEERREGEVVIRYQPDYFLRRSDRLFLEKRCKEEEEEKRLFYVAVTRAKDALFLSGIWNGYETSRLGWLKESLHMRQTDGGFKIDGEIEGLYVLDENMVDEAYRLRKEECIECVCEEWKSYKEKIAQLPSLMIKNVTEEIEERVRHGEGWVVFGEVLHKILEELSKGYLKANKVHIKGRAQRLFLLRGLSSSEISQWVSRVVEHYLRLKENGLLGLVLPCEKAYAELPFVLRKKGISYMGRIDRVVLKDGEVNVYDYKTFPVSEKEVKSAINTYRFQLKLYKEAASKIFDVKRAQGFIIFTERGEMYPV